MILHFYMIRCLKTVLTSISVFHPLQLGRPQYPEFLASLPLAYRGLKLLDIISRQGKHFFGSSQTSPGWSAPAVVSPSSQDSSSSATMQLEKKCTAQQVPKIATRGVSHPSDGSGLQRLWWCIVGQRHAESLHLAAASRDSVVPHPT